MTEIRKGYEGRGERKQPGLSEKKEGERVTTENDLVCGPLLCMAFTSPFFLNLSLDTDIDCSNCLFPSTV